MQTLPKAAHAAHAVQAVPRLVRVLNKPWIRVAALLIAVATSLYSFERVPDASWTPALLGLVPWAVGKYLFCPLRWHALSSGGQARRWHLRVYAESELLGLVSPAHAGADLWRVHKLERVGLNRTSAVAEVALDRLIGAIGLTVFVVVAGAALPATVLVAVVGVALAALVIALVVRRLRPNLLEKRPLPTPKVAAKGIALSMAYQLTIMCMLMGTTSAMGHEISPLALLGIFGASQVAGIVPGVHGASPRDGALVVGLASLGLTWTAAVGAVALVALLAWLPALAFGGGSFAARRWTARRAAATA